MKRTTPIRMKYWITFAVLFIAVGGVILFRTRLKEQSSKSNQSVIQSAEAVNETIITSVSGSGTLLPENTEDITIPEGVKVDTLYVNTGDRVAQGTVIAELNRFSILSALSEVQKEIDVLNSQIEAQKSDTPSAYVKTGVTGRVKNLYGEAGNSVLDVMRENNALALLSLDGKMAVEINNAELSVNDTVTVVLSSGNEMSGTVESIEGTNAIITLTDDGPEDGEEVTVTDGEKALGTGTLYIHAPFLVVGYTGTINSVNIGLNDNVASDTALFTLSDLGHTSEYEALMEQHAQLTQSFAELTGYYQNRQVIAPFDGMIADVTDEAESMSAYGADSSTLGSVDTVQTSQLNTAPSGGVFLLKTLVRPLVLYSDASIFGDESAPNEMPEAGDESAPTEMPEAGDESAPTEIPETGDVSAPTEMPETGENSAFAEMPEAGGVSTDTSSSDDKADSSEPTEQKETAASKESEKTNTEKASSETTKTKTAAGKSGSSASTGNALSSAGVLSVGTNSGSSDSSVSSGKSNGESSSGTMQTEVFVASIEPNTKMTIRVNVDELDILSVSVGQTANVTIDALGTTVVGTVTAIATEGSTSGGVTKYAVDVTIERTEKMRTNMNASVEIVVDSVENVLTIPEKALNQRNNTTYVYTEKAEDGTLSGEREVSTGLSDGTTVQITEGLTEGETVYYSSGGAASTSSNSLFQLPDISFGGSQSTGKGRGSGKSGERSGKGGSKS